MQTIKLMIIAVSVIIIAMFIVALSLSHNTEAQSTVTTTIPTDYFAYNCSYIKAQINYDMAHTSQQWTYGGAEVPDWYSVVAGDWLQIYQIDKCNV